MTDLMQRASFEQDGYAVFERALAGPLLEILRQECAEVIARLRFCIAGRTSSATTPPACSAAPTR